MSNLTDKRQKLEVLDQRAQKLAEVPASVAERELVAQVAVVHVGQERYGIPVEAVVEVIKAPGVTALPGLPPWMPGIVHVRGKALAVVDLSRWFRVGVTLRCDYLVILAGTEGLLGLLVESVGEFRPVFADEIALSLQEIAVKSGRPFLATTQDLLTLIDPVQLFNNPEVLAFRRAEAVDR